MNRVRLCHFRPQLQPALYISKALSLALTTPPLPVSRHFRPSRFPLKQCNCESERTDGALPLLLSQSCRAELLETSAFPIYVQIAVIQADRSLSDQGLPLNHATQSGYVLQRPSVLGICDSPMLLGTVF